MFWAQWKGSHILLSSWLVSPEPFTAEEGQTRGRFRTGLWSRVGQGSGDATGSLTLMHRALRCPRCVGGTKISSLFAGSKVMWATLDCITC
jgi:hypothetical protein